MGTDQLQKLAAGAGLLGGTGIVLIDVAQIADLVSTDVVGLVEIPITVLVLFALPALYAAQAARAGWIGLSGFVLAYTGVALGMGEYWLEAFIRPVVADSPDVMKAIGAGPLEPV